MFAAAFVGLDCSGFDGLVGIDEHCLLVAEMKI